MKKIFKTITLICMLLPLLGTVSYRDKQTGGCTGLPDFSKKGSKKATIKNVTWKKIGDKIYVFGEIKNRSNKKWLTNVTVSGTLKDSSGTTIGSGTADVIGRIPRRIPYSNNQIDESVIAPKSVKKKKLNRGTFTIEFSKPTSDIDSAEVTIDSKSKRLTIPLEGNEKTFKFSAGSFNVNNKIVKGTVRNLNNFPVWNATVYLKIKEKKGEKRVLYFGSQQVGESKDLTDIGTKSYALSAKGSGEENSGNFRFNIHIDEDEIDIQEPELWLMWEESLPSAPSKPKDLKAEELTTNGKPAVKLTWTDSSTDEDGYYVYRKKGKNSFNKLKSALRVTDEKVTTGTIITYKDKKVERGAKYTYKVTAFKDTNINESNSSNKVDITISK